MRVLIINGHPRKESLCAALTEAYAGGARQAGMEVHVIYVCEMDFNPNVIHVSPHLQSQEPDIIAARESILWADHVVFAYPTWWGTLPAMLKGFIDRVFTSGFAFEEIEGGTGYLPLLGGRTASIITTMDTPRFVYHLIYHAPGHNALGKATLAFSGFSMGRILRFGTVRHSNSVIRRQWLEKAFAGGKSLQNGAMPVAKRTMLRIVTWLKALRLQFYPMTFIGYLAGAYGAYRAGYGFDILVFWIGYAWLFFTEVATVFSNEFFDFKSDRENRLFSPFNGGSRVLVDRLISPKSMKKATWTALGIASISFGFLLFFVPAYTTAVALVCVTVMALALGYTVPPLKLSYRTLGEATVGITHSFAVILCGYLFQGGSPIDGFSWWLGLPLFFSVLPSIILAGIPDQLADRKAGKRTVAVRLGTKKAAQLAIVFTILPVILMAIYSYLRILPGVFSNIYYGIVPHALLLIVLLGRYGKKNNPPGRIDGLIIAALSYLVWYAVVPLINLV